MPRPPQDAAELTARSASAGDRLFAALQYPLPHHLLSRLMQRATRLRWRWFKDLVIARFIAHFGVDLADAVESDRHAYPHFNAFFTRALVPGARPLARAPEALASPVDGTVSELGRIEQGQLLQAKGHRFSVGALLGSEAAADAFEGGSFVTLYLSPRDYHRIHMPRAGRLQSMTHIGGRLFSVNPATTRAVPGLFARNERVACLFQTDAGPMALVLVGALFVGSIETVWSGVVTPPTRRGVHRTAYGEDGPRLERGAEMGRFNMGSTVILLQGAAVHWQERLAPAVAVRMGQLLGRLGDTT